MHRAVDHCRDLRLLSIIGACAAGAGSAAQDQQLKMQLKSNRRHKHGTYKEDSRTRVRTKTTSGLKALTEKRPGSLIVIRTKKESVTRKPR